MVDPSSSRHAPDSLSLQRDAVARWIARHELPSVELPDCAGYSRSPLDGSNQSTRPPASPVVGDPWSGGDAFARRVAWVQAYIDADDPQAAAVCFTQLRKSAGSAMRHSTMLKLAEAVASSFMQAGQADEAAALLRSAAPWGPRPLPRRPPMTPEGTVVASNPLLTSAPKSTPATASSEPSLDSVLSSIFEEKSNTSEMDYEADPDGDCECGGDCDCDAITAVFRSPLVPA